MTRADQKKLAGVKCHVLVKSKPVPPPLPDPFNVYGNVWRVGSAVYQISMWFSYCQKVKGVRQCED